MPTKVELEKEIKALKKEIRELKKTDYASPATLTSTGVGVFHDGEQFNVVKLYFNPETKQGMMGEVVRKERSYGPTTAHGKIKLVDEIILLNKRLKENK